MLKPPLQPMLLSTKNRPFNSPDYIFEYKWDGFRCLFFYDQNSIILNSRNNKNLTPYFSELKELKDFFNTNIVLDGEICYFDPEGNNDFSILQKRLQSKRKEIRIKYPVTLITWDILYVDDREIYQLPLMKRKEFLNKYVTKENNLLQLSPFLLEKGEDLFKEAKKQNMEGIVAKKIDSPYEFKRSKYWFKIKIWKYTEVLIGGYTIDKSALLVGRKDNKEKIEYLGKVKSALNPEAETALFRYLPTINIKNSPFENISKGNIIWVKPLIKARVRYTEITRNNQFRHGYIVSLLID